MKPPAPEKADARYRHQSSRKQHRPNCGRQSGLIAGEAIITGALSIMAALGMKF
jgi:hypothetical protein